uniref:hypothetical protein n=1 Tax=Azospirillum argentinense TaxID=2970906 RepID=UPI0027E34BCC|nr:hypothetical protein [Azospirillum argentinense]
MPSSGAYRHRFGSVVRAYSLISYRPGRDHRYIEINRHLRDLHPRLVEDTLARIRQAGGRVVIDARTDLLTVNEEFTVSLVLSRCQDEFEKTTRRSPCRRAFGNPVDPHRPHPGSEPTQPQSKGVFRPRREHRHGRPEAPGHRD